GQLPRLPLAQILTQLLASLLMTNSELNDPARPSVALTAAEPPDLIVPRELVAHNCPLCYAVRRLRDVAGKHRGSELLAPHSPSCTRLTAVYLGNSGVCNPHEPYWSRLTPSV